MGVRLGEQELKDLYARFSPAAYRRALYFVRREADAWDIVQEVFRRLLENPAPFRGEARPMSYIYRATTHVALNWLRARALREPAGAEAPEARHEPQVIEARQLLEALAQRLGERELELAVLHFVDGLTQEEIAQVLQVSRKTVVRDLEKIRRRAAELVGERPGSVA